MSDEQRELAKKWLKKADHDLFTADKIINFKDSPTDIICFHTQQVVEKALKAILVYKEIDYPRTHNLVRLLEIIIDLLPDLDKYREDFAEMTNYGIEIRYPDEDFEPSKEEAEKSLEIAKQVLDRVKEFINKNS